MTHKQRVVHRYGVFNILEQDENVDVVNIFLRLKQDENRLVEELLELRVCGEATVQEVVKTWLRKFQYRCKVAHGRQKFFEKYKDWLNDSFVVIICD